MTITDLVLFAAATGMGGSAAPPAPPGGPLALGTLTPNTSVDPGCPAGYTCFGFDLAAPGVTSDIPGFYAVAAHRGTPRGLVVFFTGGGGQEWWSTQYGAGAYQMAEELRDLGFSIVQVRWRKNWLESSPGNDAGQAHLACRPATVIQHVHDQHYAPLGLSPRAGQAGFCITGNSGGSSQVSYALSHFGLEDFLDVVVPTEGPPHSDMARSCLETDASAPWYYPAGVRRFIDRGFGFFGGNGPAESQDPTFRPRWDAESVGTGGSDYHHPQTRIHFILTTEGMTEVSATYRDRLRSANTPMMAVESLSGLSHGVAGHPEGLQAIKRAILGSSTGRRHVSMEPED